MDVSLSSFYVGSGDRAWVFRLVKKHFYQRRPFSSRKQKIKDHLWGKTKTKIIYGMGEMSLKLRIYHDLPEDLN